MNASEPYYPPYVPDWQEELWLGFTLLMFLAWWAFFARRFRNEFSLPERLLAAFVATVAQIQGSIFIFGFLRLIGYWELGAANALFTLILIIRIATLKGGNNILQEIGLFFASVWRLLRSSIALQAIAILAALVSFWHIYIGQLLPPFGHDPWGYHLSWTAFAHQERHLGPFDFPHPYINHYPMNTEMLFLWSIVGCGTERWANIVQGIFAVVSILPCYLLARVVGARRSDAAIAGLLLLSVPGVFHMMWLALVDIATMGGALAALAFVARRKLTPASCAIAGCAAGFTLGSKGLGVYLIASLLLLLIYRLFPLGMDGFRHSPKFRLKRMALTLVIFIGLSLAFGSYFYIRNLVLTGNPTGVFTVELAGKTIFEGEEDIGARIANRILIGDLLYEALQEGKEWPIVLDGFFDPQVYYTHANRIGGWGAVWTVLLLPAIPFALLWALIRRKWSVIAIIVCCLIPYFLFKENRFWLRFHFQVLCAGTTAFAYLLALLRQTHYRRPLLAIAAILMALMVLVASPPPGQLLIPDDIIDARKSPYLYSDRYVYFNSWGDPGFADALRSVQGAGTTLALTKWMPDRRHLAAWNPHFTNRVVWVGYEGSGSEWEAGLDEKGAHAVFVQIDQEALNWANGHPERFQRIYQSHKLGAIFVLKDDDGSE